MTVLLEALGVLIELVIEGMRLLIELTIFLVRRWRQRNQEAQVVSTITRVLR